MANTPCNLAQQKIIEQVDGYNLVIAGAGTGKTTTILKKIEHMLLIGIPPQQILALTFTNKAANEMKERINVKEDICIDTFHSFCLRVLKEHKEFTLINEEKSRIILKKFLVGDELNRLEEIKRSVSFLKNQSVEHHLLLENADNHQMISNLKNEKRIKEIYALYQAHLKEVSLYDFDDLIIGVITLLNENDSLLNALQERYRYVLVDEFQDTNYAQLVLLQLITRKHANLCAVGDDFQSIYGFRGGNIENILFFERYFPHATRFILDENYRSTQTILKSSNQLIKKNKQQSKKELFTSNPKGEKIKIFEAKMEKEEIDHLIQLLQTIPPSEYGETVVLYRSHRNKELLEAELSKTSISFECLSDSDTVSRQNTIKLMTIHQAKGLEFLNVFVIGMENGNFPNRFALNDKLLLEEERRLFYVAITRAKQRVFLSYSNNKQVKTKSGNLMLVEQEPSLFLKELGKTTVLFEKK